METGPLTQDSFDSLLKWLDSDRERAGVKYESIRSRLIEFFSNRGMTAAEDLADETINRVARKLPDIGNSYVGDPVRYFYGVAKKISLEYLRQKSQVISPPTVYSSQQDNNEDIYDCLERCLQQLPPKHRELLLAYYKESKEGKFPKRRELTQQLGVRYNALRVRVHRLRSHLEKCIQMCLEKKIP